MDVTIALPINKLFEQTMNWEATKCIALIVVNQLSRNTQASIINVFDLTSNDNENESYFYVDFQYLNEVCCCLSSSNQQLF